MLTPTGIAISGDSRTTGTRTEQLVSSAAVAGSVPTTVQVPWIVSDSTRKLFCVQERVAVATWGAAFLNGLPTGHHVNDFILASAANALESTESFADALMSHFVGLAPGVALYT